MDKAPTVIVKKGVYLIQEPEVEYEEMEENCITCPHCKEKIYYGTEQHRYNDVSESPKESS